MISAALESCQRVLASHAAQELFLNDLYNFFVVHNWCRDGIGDQRGRYPSSSVVKVRVETESGTGALNYDDSFSYS